MTPKKKLIEVALPLEAINAAAAREKSIRHGHPSRLHLWWARRPLAAARAVIFAQMVDDPSSYPDLFPTEAKQQKEREQRLAWIDRPRMAVKDWLTREIAYWNHRAGQLKLQEQAGKAGAHLNSREAGCRADALQRPRLGDSRC